MEKTELFLNGIKTIEDCRKAALILDCKGQTDEDGYFSSAARMVVGDTLYALLVGNALTPADLSEYLFPSEPVPTAAWSPLYELLNLHAETRFSALLLSPNPVFRDGAKGVWTAIYDRFGCLRINR